MQDKTLEAVLRFKDEMSKTIKKSEKTLKDFQKQAESLDKALGGTESKVKSFSKGVLGATAAVGTLAGGLLGKAISDANSFESAFTGVIKTVDGSPEQLNKLRTSILNMTTEMPKTAEELSEIAEAAGQLGIGVNDIEKFTKVVAQLSDATDIQGGDGAMQLAQFMNVMQMNKQDIDKLGSTIAYLGNNSATTESKILNMSSRIAGSLSLLGVAPQEVMGISAAMASVGIEAEMGGTAFSKMAIDMKNAISKGSESLEQFAKVSGMTSEQFASSFNENAARTIGKFLEGLGTSSNPYAILDEMEIKEVRLRQTMLSLAKTHAEYNDFLDKSNQGWRENVALANEAERRYGTTASELAIMKNEIRLASIEIGTAMLPLVRDLAEFLGGLAKKFNALSPETKRFISYGLLAVVALGALASVIAFVVFVVTNLAMAFSFAAPVIAALCSPIGLVVLALVALNLFVAWFRKAWENNWNGMRDKVQAFVDKVKGYWEGLKNWFLENPVVAFVNEQWNKATSKKPTGAKGGNKGKKEARNAFGSGRIARNDELRRLHEGEKVLTKGEADRYERGLGGYGDVKVYVNGLTVREEADIDRIANALAVKIRNRRMTLGGVRV